MLKAPRSPSTWLNSEANYCELNPALAAGCDRAARPPFCAQDSYVDLLTAEQNGGPAARNSDTSYLILDDDDGAKPWEPLPTQRDKGQEDEGTFVTPLLETASSFKPNDLESKLLPPENKPLETAMLKRAKELFTNNDPKIIAQHMLNMDCKVGARRVGLVGLPNVWKEDLSGPHSALPCDCFAHRKTQMITWVWGFI